MSGANIYTAWETQFWKTPPAALLIPGSFFLRVFFEISHIMPENEYNWCLGLKYCWGWEGLSRSLSKYTLDFWFTFWYVKCVCRFALRKPLFEIWWFYMGIAQIALDPPTLCQTDTVERFLLDPISFSCFICFLTLPKWFKKCTNYPVKRSDLPETRNCPFGHVKKSAPNHPGKR